MKGTENTPVGGADRTIVAQRISAQTEGANGNHRKFEALAAKLATLWAENKPFKLGVIAVAVAVVLATLVLHFISDYRRSGPRLSGATARRCAAAHRPWPGCWRCLG